jgi:hypothetical protein
VPTLLLHFFAREIRQEKERKGIQIGKEEVNLSLFADDRILHLKDLKDSTKNLLDFINAFGKVAGYKLNIRKPLAFLYTTVNG